MPFCTTCGAPQSDKFCTKCGSREVAPAEPSFQGQQSSNKPTTIVTANQGDHLADEPGTGSLGLLRRLRMWLFVYVALSALAWIREVVHVYKSDASRLTVGYIVMWAFFCALLIIVTLPFLRAIMKGSWLARRFFWWVNACYAAIVFISILGGSSIGGFALPILNALICLAFVVFMSKALLNVSVNRFVCDGRPPWSFQSRQTLPRAS